MVTNKQDPTFKVFAPKTDAHPLSHVLLALGMVLGLVGALVFTVPPVAQADHRPFPKYEMTFQKLAGTRDPNWSPGDPGDGCIRQPEVPPGHLTHFGFRAMLDHCEGVRTTIRFYLEEDSPGSPTLQFRFGTTWQYQTEEMLSNNDLQLKAVENFLYDGEPVSPEQYDPENPAVVDSEGNLVRMGGDGLYEPFHYTFEDTFGAGEEHTIQFDSYFPADGDNAALTWGTGSTGDTTGGSIGATANGLWVSPPAKMDFRYVLHSEYLAARGIAQDAELTKDFGLPGLPERKWATTATGIEDTTFDLLSCLEERGQHLADVATSLPVNQIYGELPYDTPTLFEDKVGTSGFAQWPWQWYVYQDGQWQPKTGLRPMNRNGTAFDPYLNADGSYMELPYKPTVESLILDIPGYDYVDNDITILEKGQFDVNQPANSYKYNPGPNVLLRKVNGANTQHFYYTYRPAPGTFELSKAGVSYTWNDDEKNFDEKRQPLEGAEFELYEVVDTKTTPCGLAPDLTNTETVTVCDAKTPSSAEELEDLVTADPTGCEEKTVRKIVLEGTEATDGTFTTNADGIFSPEGEPSLTPGNYLVREVSAPDEHIILHEWIPFTIPLQVEETTSAVVVQADNYLPPPPPPTPTPTPTTTPPVPTSPTTTPPETTTVTTETTPPETTTVTPPTVTVPLSTPPSTPPAITPPATPPNKPPHDPEKPILAITGTNVAKTGAIALLFCVVGLALIRSHRRSN